MISSARHEAFLAGIDKLYNDFINYGIIEYTPDLPFPLPFIYRHLNKVAKELRKPIIWIKPEYPNRWSLRIPRLVRNQVLQAPLIIGARNVRNRWQDNTVEVTILPRTVTSTFYFNGPNGRAILDNWIQEARTNPDMRKALKLE